ncbi:MAG TPA: hypothetical protein DCM67_01485 [Propionibacteriaceae bacterium]|nr:hypothetical protein [Propionibacteriaceae bacterium]
MNTPEPETGGELLVYLRDDGTPAIDVRLTDDTVWLSQQQLADLFQTSRTNVVEHLRHIYEEGELLETATCRDFRQVRQEGNREVTRSIPHYNLNAWISPAMTRTRTRDGLRVAIVG